NPAAEINLRGKIVDETGEPVTDAEIELQYTRNYQSTRAKTDASGEYRFKKVAEAGEYLIAINSKRWVGITDRKNLTKVELSPSGQTVRDFVLPRACRLRVRTVDEQGQPVAGVTVLSSLTEENQNFAAMATTDKQGQAMLNGLRPSEEARLVA